MSELLDKQVDAQNFGGSRKLPQAHVKVCNEMKQTKKKDAHVKMLLKEGNPLKRLYKILVKMICMSFGEIIMDIMKVLFKWVNWSQVDGFLSVDVQMGAIKLAMAGTQDWWH